jgi:steroid delta-isomerase-like uncharacterized protein
LAAFFAAACQPAAAPAPDYAAVQQPAIDAYLGGWSTGNLDGLDAALAPNVMRRSSAGMNADNLDELKAAMTALRTAYPDAKVVSDETIHMPNAAVLRWTFTGTNTGPGDTPPTGKSVSLSGLTLLRFADGKITEEHVAFDAADWYTQLGYTITPAAAE